MRKRLLLPLLLAAASPASAVEFHFDGYADFRMIKPSNEGSWEDGELGKTRYGDRLPSPNFRFAEAIAQGVAEVTPELMAIGVARIEPEQKTFFDVLEAYVRYRPVSTSRWRWTFKAGAFFPPISLENTELGWTSPWTLTPSAVNSWVGDELRTIGAEAKLEWRSEERTIAAYGSGYGWNDPAGILLADRGWAMHDRPTGLIEQPRLPDVIAYQRNLPEPLHTYEFLEIDGTPGWYAGGSWDETGLGHLDFLYYNNQANPKKIRYQVAWDTRFWDVGASTHIGPVTLLTQGMIGDTLIEPSPFFTSDTDFAAAYLLAGWMISDDWRIAGRADVFSTSEDHTGRSLRMSEHGNALTFAVNYLPYDWLRLTAEALVINSWRPQRTLDAMQAHFTETQFQLSARFYVP